jgi:hypothetical protein
MPIRSPITTPLGNYTVKPPPQFAVFGATLREAARATMAGAGSFSAAAPPTH